MSEKQEPLSESEAVELWAKWMQSVETRLEIICRRQDRHMRMLESLHHRLNRVEESADGEHEQGLKS